MTNHPTPASTRTSKTYSVDDLLAMDDVRFGTEATADLRYTGRFKSNFQHKDVVDRTLHALLEKLWFVSDQIDKQREDPEVTPEHFQRTCAFRRHLLSVIDLTERRADRNYPGASTARAWRQVLNELCDELEGGPMDWLLDDFLIPLPSMGSDNGDMSLRTWVGIRRVKSPERIPNKEEVAA